MDNADSHCAFASAGEVVNNGPCGSTAAPTVVKIQTSTVSNAVGTSRVIAPTSHFLMVNFKLARLASGGTK